jgi:hypothetical protein
MQDDPPFGGARQFTVDEVQSVLLELDVSKNAGPDGIPPLILKNCASAFARSVHFLFFLTDLYRNVFFPTGGNFPTILDTDIQERQSQKRRGLSWGGYISGL